MGVLLSGNPGSVVQLADEGVQCTVRLVTVGTPGAIGEGISFASQRSIVTRFTTNQQVNIQFLHTLGNLVYVHAFGDRMGQFSLSGLSFACPCPERADPNGIISARQGEPIGGDHGPEQMLLWYKRNKASARRTPLRIAVGVVVFEGFVVGFTEDVVDPSIQLVQWGVNLAALPQD